MELWIHWQQGLLGLRPAFSHYRTFLWFCVCVAGSSIKTDKLGVSSIIRSLGLGEGCYHKLLNMYHSNAIDLDKLNACWVRVVLSLFKPVRYNERIVLVADGIKIPKEGRKMPGVKKLHQESDSNSKPEYIMGHSFQGIGLLSHAGTSVVAVPLIQRIHEGVVSSNRDKRTLLDKILIAHDQLGVEEPHYVVADAYYASGKCTKGLLKSGNHLVTRARINATACHKPKPLKPGAPKRRGRKRIYGDKVRLRELFEISQGWKSVSSPIYGESNSKIEYRVMDLLWKPTQVIVRFVLVRHSKGNAILMTTDLTLSGIEVIEIYGLRFKIEFSFKQAIHIHGSFSYHFWMSKMDKTKRNGGDQYLHRKSKAYRDATHRKIKAYNVFVQIGIVSQGLMQYLSASHNKLVWSSFGSWLRTIRPGLPPSEFVVSIALQNTFKSFLSVNSSDDDMAKFIVNRQDIDSFKFLYGNAA